MSPCLWVCLLLHVLKLKIIFFTQHLSNEDTDSHGDSHGEGQEESGKGQEESSEEEKGQTL